jgi:hypothetical protein
MESIKAMICTYFQYTLNINILLFRKMIFCQMILKSPANKERTPENDFNSKQVVHLTARQLSTARILHDDILYSKLILSKIIILGQLVSA